MPAFCAKKAAKTHISFAVELGKEIFKMDFIQLEIIYLIYYNNIKII